MSYRHVLASALCSLLLACVPDVAAQTTAPSLARARDLYLAADYDGALATLAELRAGSPEYVEGTTYRVFCLLALGRTPEATREIEAIVAADPFYVPSESMASPRILEVFRATRRAVLPAVGRREYDRAKAAFDRRDPASTALFESVLRLLADPDFDSPLARDMRVLAEGFRDLSRTFEAPSAPAQAAPRPAAGPTAQQAPGGSTTQVQAPPASGAGRTTEATRAPATGQPAPPDAAPSGTGRGGTAQAAGAPPGTAPGAAPRAGGAAADAAAADSLAREGEPGVVPPVAIDQPMPRWIPPSGSPDRRQTFEGILELRIDARGTVTSALVREGIHPQFDAELIRLARGWRFRPATRNGVPTAYLKIVLIRLNPSGR